MNKIARVTCLWSVIVAVCSLQFAGSARAAGGVKVEVLMYSGRPNPTFVLKDKKQLEQTRMLMKKSRSMKGTEKAEVPPVLGYRGLLVENEGNVKGLPARFVVYNGNVEVLGKEKGFFGDSGREFEKYLLNEAAKQKVIEENAPRTLGVEK